MKRARDGRGETLFVALVCGIPCLFAGILAAATTLFSPPVDRFERVAAGAVAVMGIAFGIGFIASALPERWGAAGKLWRWCGWLLALAILPFAVLLLSSPTTAAQHSTRIRSSFGAIVSGLGALLLAGAIARAWLLSVREHRR